MSIVYRKYLRTRWRIAALEKQFRDYNNMDLLLSLDLFRSHTAPSKELIKNKNNLLQMYLTNKANEADKSHSITLREISRESILKGSIRTEVRGFRVKY